MKVVLCCDVMTCFHLAVLNMRGSELAQTSNPVTKIPFSRAKRVSLNNRQAYIPGITGIFPATSKTLISQVYSSCIPGIFQVYTIVIPGISQVYPRSIPGLSQVYTIVIPAIFQVYPRSIPGISQLYPGISQVLPRCIQCSQVCSKRVCQPPGRDIDPSCGLANDVSQWMRPSLNPAPEHGALAWLCMQ